MQILDDKKDVIILILERLRHLNPAIGTYQKSVLSHDHKYAVKLNNGRINLSRELVHDFDQSPVFVNEDQFMACAQTFIEDSIPQSATTPIPNSATQSQISQKGGQKSKSSYNGILTIAVIIVLGLAGYYLYTLTNSEQESAVKEEENNQVEESKAHIRNNIRDYVTVETNEYNYNDLGGVSNLVLTVKNKTNYALDNVKVKLSYIKKNGDVWQSINVDFPLVTANGGMTMKMSDTNRGTSVKCMIVSVTSNSLGL